MEICSLWLILPAPVIYTDIILYNIKMYSNNNCYLSSKSVGYIIMIYEGACNTEGWNLALPLQN